MSDHVAKLPTPVQICVIFNPSARGEKAKRLRSQLESRSNQCALKPTTAPGAARALAAEAVREGYGTIVAAGGDGTVNEVLNGIGDEPDGFSRARLGVLPVGTVNVFARELGIPFRLARAWEIICRGSELSIDLPEMEFESQGQKQRRYFAQMAGSGLDARAVQLVDWHLKKTIGQFAYVVAGIKALREKPFAITVSNGSHTMAAELVIIGNGRYYGGQIPIFHQANFRDGLLDVCVFPKANWFAVMRYAWAYISQRLVKPGREM